MLVSSGLETRAEGRVGREEEKKERCASSRLAGQLPWVRVGGRRQSSLRDRATLCMRWLGGKVGSVTGRNEWMRQMEKQAVDGGERERGLDGQGLWLWGGAVV